MMEDGFNRRPHLPKIPKALQSRNFPVANSFSNLLEMQPSKALATGHSMKTEILPAMKYQAAETCEFAHIPQHIDTQIVF